MSRSKKFLDKVRRNPKDVPWEMAIKILSDYGFELINPRRGSHYKATHPSAGASSHSTKTPSSRAVT